MCGWGNNRTETKRICAERKCIKNHTCRRGIKTEPGESEVQNEKNYKTKTTTTQRKAAAPASKSLITMVGERQPSESKWLSDKATVCESQTRPDLQETKKRKNWLRKRVFNASVQIPDCTELFGAF